MNFIQNYISDLKKKDTFLAFLVSYILHYVEHKNIKQSLLFSIKFVLIFLFFLNLLF